MKQCCTAALAAAMIIAPLGSNLSVFAAETTGTNQTEAATGYSLLSDNKVPRQLNVHVGNNASHEVNVTYTTVEDTTTTVIALNKAGDSQVTYVEGTSYLGIGGKYIHEIAVTGLEAYTEYEYTVGDGFNSTSGTFKTALEQGSNQPFTFVYLADTQVSNGTNAEALGATLAEVNNMNPDLVYLAGDVTNTAADEVSGSIYSQMKVLSQQVESTCSLTH